MIWKKLFNWLIYILYTKTKKSGLYIFYIQNQKKKKIDFLKIDIL